MSHIKPYGNINEKETKSLNFSCLYLIMLNCGYEEEPNTLTVFNLLEFLSLSLNCPPRLQVCVLLCNYLKIYIYICPLKCCLVHCLILFVVSFCLLFSSFRKLQCILICSGTKVLILQVHLRIKIRIFSPQQQMKIHEVFFVYLTIQFLFFS